MGGVPRRKCVQAGSRSRGLRASPSPEAVAGAGEELRCAGASRQVKGTLRSVEGKVARQTRWPASSLHPAASAAPSGDGAAVQHGACGQFFKAVH